MLEKKEFVEQRGWDLVESTEQTEQAESRGPEKSLFKTENCLNQNSSQLHAIPS